MATVFYGIAGEGRGHATRARAVIEALRPHHRLVIYTYGQALSLLGPLYKDTEVRVRNLPGLGWSYGASGRPDYARTFFSAVPFLVRVPTLVRRLVDDMCMESPDLVVSDFEPLTARAAKQYGIPFVSLDHQHFLTTYDLTSLPRHLALHARVMAKAVDLYHHGAAETVVSAFFRPPLRSGVEHVTQVGPLLRPEVLAAKRQSGSHVVAYVRRDASANLLLALRHCGAPVHLYGLGERPRQGSLEFRRIAGLAFVDDLARARALICTAGNQLIGEALYLQKPVFAMPERGNHEQEINAHFIEHAGLGETASMDLVHTSTLRQFLERTESLRACINPAAFNGNREAVARVNAYLPYQDQTTERAA